MRKLSIYTKKLNNSSTRGKQQHGGTGKKVYKAIKNGQTIPRLGADSPFSWFDVLIRFERKSAGSELGDNRLATFNFRLFSPC